MCRHSAVVGRIRGSVIVIARMVLVLRAGGVCLAAAASFLVGDYRLAKAFGR
jgi:hypothetical protein